MQGAMPQPASELKLRVISAIIMAIAIIGATLMGGLPFRIVWAMVGGFVLYEWLTIIGVLQARATWPAVAMALLSVITPPAWLLVLGAVAIGLLALALTQAPELRKFAFAGALYAVVLAAGPSFLREMAGGLAIILWSFAVTWGTDIAAYFVGRKLGGPKLSPRFSPKKTWSGAIGGAVLGTGAAMLVWWGMGKIGPVPGTFGQALVVSLVASIVGQMGDIGESALKRRFGVKDSSQLIPGHGGFMDRLDAYWAVIALASLIALAARA